MEARVLQKLEAQLTSKSPEITIEGLYVVKMTDAIKETIEKFADRKKLSLMLCKLASLQNMPNLPDLESLQLNDNFLKDADLEIIASFKKLKYLYIGGNKIKELKSFEVLKNLQHLKFIDVYGNPFMEGNKNYLKDMFEMLPQLKVIDYLDRNKKEVDDFYTDDTEEESEGEDDDDEFISYDEEEQQKNKDREMNGKIKNDEKIDESQEEVNEDEGEGEGENDDEEDDIKEHSNQIQAEESSQNNNNDANANNLPEENQNSDYNKNLKRDLSENKTTEEFGEDKASKKVNNGDQNSSESQ